MPLNPLVFSRELQNESCKIWVQIVGDTSRTTTIRLIRENPVVSLLVVQNTFFSLRHDAEIVTANLFSTSSFKNIATKSYPQFYPQFGFPVVTFNNLQRREAPLSC